MALVSHSLNIVKPIVAVPFSNGIRKPVTCDETQAGNVRVKVKNISTIKKTLKPWSLGKENWNPLSISLTQPLMSPKPVVDPFTQFPNSDIEFASPISHASSNTQLSSTKFMSVTKQLSISTPVSATIPVSVAKPVKYSKSVAKPVSATKDVSGVNCRSASTLKPATITQVPISTSQPYCESAMNLVSSSLPVSGKQIDSDATFLSTNKQLSFSQQKSLTHPRQTVIPVSALSSMLAVYPKVPVTPIPMSVTSLPSTWSPHKPVSRSVLPKKHKQTIISVKTSTPVSSSKLLSAKLSKHPITSVSVNTSPPTTPETGFKPEAAKKHKLSINPESTSKHMLAKKHKQPITLMSSNSPLAVSKPMSAKNHKQAITPMSASTQLSKSKCLSTRNCKQLVTKVSSSKRVSPEKNEHPLLLESTSNPLSAGNCKQHMSPISVSTPVFSPKKHEQPLTSASISTQMSAKGWKKLYTPIIVRTPWSTHKSVSVKKCKYSAPSIVATTPLPNSKHVSVKIPRYPITPVSVSKCVSSKKHKQPVISVSGNSPVLASSQQSTSNCVSSKIPKYPITPVSAKNYQQSVIPVSVSTPLSDSKCVSDESKSKRKRKKLLYIPPMDSLLSDVKENHMVDQLHSQSQLHSSPQLHSCSQTHTDSQPYEPHSQTSPKSYLGWQIKTPSQQCHHSNLQTHSIAQSQTHSVRPAQPHLHTGQASSQPQPHAHLQLSLQLSTPKANSNKNPPPRSAINTPTMSENADVLKPKTGFGSGIQTGKDLGVVSGSEQKKPLERALSRVKMALSSKLFKPRKICKFIWARPGAPRVLKPRKICKFFCVGSLIKKSVSLGDESALPKEQGHLKKKGLITIQEPLIHTTRRTKRAQEGHESALSTPKLMVMKPTGPQELPGEQVINEKHVKAKILKQPKRSKKKSHQNSLSNSNQQTKAKSVKRRNTVDGKITAKKRNNRRKNIVSAEQGTNVYIGVSNTDVCCTGSISYTCSIDKQSCVSSAIPLIKNTSTQNKSVDNPDGGIIKQKRNTQNKSRSKGKQKITGKECKSTDKQKITGKEYKSTDKQNESKGIQNNIIDKKCKCTDKQNKSKRIQNKIADKEHKSTDKQNGSKEKSNIIGKQKRKNICTRKANNQISISGTIFHTNSIPGSTDKQQGNLPRSQQNLENNKSWRSSTGSLVDESGIFTVSQKTLFNSQLYTLNHDSSQTSQTSLKRKIADGSTSVDSQIKKMKIQVHPLDIHASPFISSQPTVPSVSTLFVPGSTVVDSIGKKIYKEGKYENVLSGLPYLSRFFQKLISSADSESDMEDFRPIPSSLRSVQEPIDDQNGKLKSKPGIQKVIKEEKRKKKKEEGKQNTISGGNKGKRKKKRNEEEMEAIVPAPLKMPSVLRRLLRGRTMSPDNI